MSTMDFIFAGIDISSGKKPITFTVLDNDLKIILLERCDVPYAIAHLGQYKRAMLGVNMLYKERAATSQRVQTIREDIRKRLMEAGIKPYLSNNASKQWVETNPMECFRSLSGQTPQSQRTLGGLIQRALILHDEGLQIKDPMEFFEEITRHHLMAGVMPMELLYSASELDALAAAYITWLLINKPVQVDLTKNRGEGMILIPREDKNWWRKKPVTS